MNQTFKLQDYLSEHSQEGLKVSIYLPTHRSIPDARMDPIQYKNQVQKLQRDMEEQYNRREWEPVIAQLETLYDPEFWTYSTEGLAVLADASGIETFRLDQTVPERVYQGTDFDVVPLLRYYEEAHDGYLVDLSRDRVRLFRVNQYGATEMEEADFIKNFPELYDDLDPENRMHMGGTRTDQSVMHGHRAKPEEVEKDRTKYFRYVDETLRKYVKPGVPVILSGTTENVADFKELAKGDFYTDKVIDKPFSSIDHNEQKILLRDILRPRYLERLKVSLEDFEYQNSQKKTVFGQPKILERAKEGRVQTLFINGDYTPESQGELNSLINQVIQTGGKVVILTEDKLKENLSAVLRY